MSLVLFSPIYCYPPSYFNLSSSSPFFFSSLVISLASFILYSGRAFRNSFWLLLFYVGFDRLQRVITTIFYTSGLADVLSLQLRFADKRGCETHEGGTNVEKMRRFSFPFGIEWKSRRLMD